MYVLSNIQVDDPVDLRMQATKLDIWSDSWDAARRFRTWTQGQVPLLSICMTLGKVYEQYNMEKIMLPPSQSCGKH